MEHWQYNYIMKKLREMELRITKCESVIDLIQLAEQDISEMRVLKSFDNEGNTDKVH